jgi:hypothetical protein
MLVSLSPTVPAEQHARIFLFRQFVQAMITLRRVMNMGDKKGGGSLAGLAMWTGPDPMALIYPRTHQKISSLWGPDGKPSLGKITFEYGYLVPLRWRLGYPSETLLDTVSAMIIGLCNPRTM